MLFCFEGRAIPNCTQNLLLTLHSTITPERLRVPYEFTQDKIQIWVQSKYPTHCTIYLPLKYLFHLFYLELPLVCRYAMASYVL